MPIVQHFTVDLRHVDLNLLVAFDALMQERSVTRAAARLYIGQSAMSATLARLRVLFDDPILIRQGRQVVPTPVADALVEPVRRALEVVGGILTKRSSFDPTRDQRTFTLIASDYLTFVFLRPLLRSLSVEAPNVKLHIRPVSEDLYQELAHNKVDLLITAREGFPQHVDFPNQELFSDRYVCAVDADHPEVGKSISPEQFQSLPYLATSAGRMRSIAEIELDRLGIQRNTEITTTLTLGFFLLIGTRLVSLVHERLGMEFQKQLKIRLLEPPVQISRITEVMIWTERNTEDPGHRWLRERLKRLAVAQFGPQPIPPHPRRRSKAPSGRRR
jgi:DNA-binding transcriptional LysR family regulator